MQTKPTVSRFVAFTFLHHFIDGTVEGTNVYQYRDEYISHDHSFYGNGCPNEWGTDGDGGSTVACLTRIVKTYDNEDQKNGTIYNTQGSTVGTGRAILTDNTDSPDTFCPLGWQLPYSGTGGDYYDKSKSWNYLFGRYSFSSLIYEKAMSYPFSYIQSGYYNWLEGRLFFQNSIGRYWASTISGEGAQYRLLVTGTDFSTNYTSLKSYGSNLRCVYILAITSSTARWKGTLLI